MFPVMIPTYNRADIAFEKGEGCWLYSTDGERFLDFSSGVATSSLGHAHPHLVRTIAEQAARVIHVSNLYQIPQGRALAQRLTELSFADSVFFCNSGAEAVETMAKIILRAQAFEGHAERNRIICFNGAFHGRTLAMIAATGNPKYLEGFGRVFDIFDHVPPEDIETLQATISEQTAGVIIEPVQGESGVSPISPAFLQATRELCDHYGLFLGFDEVQCGMGRTGRLFAHEWAGVTPDVMALAKGIGGGVPLGATLARKKLARHMTPGSHGSTYGGNPLACAAGMAVLDVMLEPGFMENVRRCGNILKQGLERLVLNFPDLFAECRGMGLLLGLQCRFDPAMAQNALLNERMLSVVAGRQTLRLLPPLIVSEAECEEALKRLARAAESLSSSL